MNPFNCGPKGWGAGMVRITGAAGAVMGGSAAGSGPAVVGRSHIVGTVLS
jgi:hypothetical protein